VLEGVVESVRVEVGVGVPLREGAGAGGFKLAGNLE
jgi:hypothetical protein